MSGFLHIRAKYLAAISLALGMLLSSCGKDEHFVPVGPPETVAALEAWWAAAGETAFEAAPGVPVAKADLEFLMAGGMDEAEARKHLTLRKLLVRKAIEKGLADDFSVAHAYQRALAHRLIKALFEEEHTADKVPDETWFQLFSERSVFPLFDHLDTFFVVDAQLICCEGAPELCREDTETSYCLQDFQSTAWEIHRELSQGEVVDGEAAKERILALQAAFPDLAHQEYSFQHDFNPANKGNHKFTIVDDAVGLGAKNTPVGTFGKPVRSVFGWHILYVKKYLPEVHLKFGDPEVMAELEKRFYGLVLRKDVMAYLKELFQNGQVEMVEAAMREVNWARVTGLR
jgi:hypothetical protein